MTEVKRSRKKIFIRRNKATDNISHCNFLDTLYWLFPSIKSFGFGYVFLCIFQGSIWTCFSRILLKFFKKNYLFFNWRIIALQNCVGFCQTSTWTLDTAFAGNCGLPWWLSGKESACVAGDAGDMGSDPWVGKICWRRKWQPTSVFLPGRPQSMWSQRIGHNWACMPVCRKSRWLIISCTTCPGKLSFLLASHFTCETQDILFQEEIPWCVLAWLTVVNHSHKHRELSVVSLPLPLI